MVKMKLLSMLLSNAKEGDTIIIDEDVIQDGIFQSVPSGITVIFNTPVKAYQIFTPDEDDNKIRQEWWGNKK